MLTFIERVDARRARYRCACGAETIAFMCNVSTGHTASCGCLRRMVTAERSITHGHKRFGQRSRAYGAWLNMKGRCDNAARPDYGNYGGRGIAYTPEWASFEAFLADMGEPAAGLTIDRIDNSRGYSKENCRWTTRAVQNLNKRNCVRYTFNGESKTLAEWSRETGIKRLTLFWRITHGIPLALALTTPGFLRMPRK